MTWSTWLHQIRLFAAKQCVNGNGRRQTRNRRGISEANVSETLESRALLAGVYGFSLPSYSVPETNANTATNVVQVTRSDSTLAESVNVVLNAGTATVGTDFQAGPVALNFLAGETVKTVSVVIIGDQIVELGQTINLSLIGFSGTGTSAGATNPSAVLTIQNDDSATLSIAAATADEGTGLGFVVTLTGQVEGNVTVPVTLAASGTAPAEVTDITGGFSTARSVTFTANGSGVSSGTQTLTIASVQDAIVELDETFSATLGTVTAPDAPVANITSPAPGNTAVGTIRNDNDSATLSIAAATADEGTGLGFVVTLTGQVEGNVTVPVTLAASGTAPAEVTDITGGFSTARSVTFTANGSGVSSGTQTLTIASVQDAIVELDETFSATLGTVTAPDAPVANITSPAPGNTAVGTIRNDNDSATLSIAAATADEGTGLGFVVTLTGQVEGNVTVPVTLAASGTAPAEVTDITGGFSTARSVTFTANGSGVSSGAQTLTIASVQDAIVELNETFSATLGTVTAPDAPVANITSPAPGNTAVGTIRNDNDSATLSIAAATADEGTGLGFVVTLTGQVEGNVTVPVTLAASGTAPAEVTDITGGFSTARSVTFTANGSGVSSGTQTLTIASVQDAIVELDETFSATLGTVTAPDAPVANITSPAPGNTAVGTIRNDDVEISVESNLDPTLTSLSSSNDEDNGNYSLREAILLSNAARGDQVIRFTGNSLSGSTPQIALQGTLPTISAPVSIEGPSNDRPEDMLRIKGATSGRILPISSLGSVSITGLHFTEGKANGTGNLAHGGALGVFGSGTVNIVNSQFSRNNANVSGGAVFAQNTAQLNISGSTFWKNTAANGGAIYVNGSSSSTVSVLNSTFDRNAATTSGGAAFINNSASRVTFDHATIADNTAGTTAGAAAVARNAANSLTIRNSIVAINNNVRSVEGSPVVATQDIVGSFTGTGNVIWAGNGTIAQGQSSDPVLSSLVDAGGRTYVRVPSNFLAGIGYRKYGVKTMSQSPALDAANSTTVLADQRGVSRPVGQRDAGAVEVQAVQSRYVELESSLVNSAGNAVTLDWETTSTADSNRSRNGGPAPGATTGLDVLITVLPGSSGKLFLDDIGNIRFNGVTPELVGRFPSGANQKLRLRFVLPQSVDSITKGLAIDDSRTQLTITGLPIGSYRAEVLGLNADNVVSAGSYAVQGAGEFAITSTSSPPPGLATRVDSLFARKDDDLLNWI